MLSMTIPQSLQIDEAFIEIADKLYTDYESEPHVEPVPHESRDGFIPHTNGGFQVLSYVTLMDAANGSGFVDKDIDKQLDQYVSSSYQSALECFAEDNAETLLKLFPTIDIDKPTHEMVNYHNLYEMGEGDLAERLSEYEFEHLDGEGCTFFIQARCFYFSKDNMRNETGEDEIFFHAGVNFDFEYGRDSGLELSYENTVKVSELTPELLTTIMDEMYNSI